MLLIDERPELLCNGIIVDNLSPDGKVAFFEENHVYLHEDDLNGNSIPSLEDSKYKFRSPTGILADFKEKFEAEKIARKYVVRHELDITWEELVDQWKKKGEAASEQGTLLHGYAESLINGWGMKQPDVPKAEYVNELIEELNNTHVLAKTELLVYSTVLRLAGQVDLLMRNEDRSEYYLYDYKFIKKPLERKSFYNPRTRKYKMMKGPFRFLHDCNYSHYSIQMSIYQYLMGNVGRKLKKKALIVVTPDGYGIVEGKPMRIWVDTEGILHARYTKFNGTLYDSSEDKVYLRKPYRLINK